MKNNNYLIVLILIFFMSTQATYGKDIVIPIKNGVQFEVGNLNQKVQFYSPEMVRVVKWVKGATPDSTSLVVVLKAIPELTIRVKENAKTISLYSDKLHVLISKSDGHIEYSDRKEIPFLKESGKSEIQPEQLKNEKTYNIKQAFKLTDDEGIYGLGQHQDGYFNYRGHSVKLVQTNTNAVSPFLISTKNYGILWDNYSKTIFEDNAQGTSIWSDVASAVDYYFISGTNMDQVISGYRDLTGHAPMYGKWAYGYWQSKEHYEDRAELLSIAKEYRDRKIPIDNIIQDWDYWDGTKNWGQLYFDEKKYPNPSEMIDILHKEHFHVMISIWCAFGPNTPVYKEMDQKGLLYPTVGWAGFKYFDAYNPAGTALFWKYTNDRPFLERNRWLVDGFNRT
jgi:alpha-D-xyloside xylohydrolase